ncbi:MAG: carbohydrate-binding domain-containing protein [Oscillospiraceae bacterium]
MKKTASLILAVLLLATLCACGAKNDANATPTDVSSASPTDIEQPAATPTPLPQPVSELVVCGIPVVTNGQPTGVSYLNADYKDGVLTLTDVKMSSEYGSYLGISFSGDLEIVLVGANSIATTNGMSAIGGGDEKIKGNLKISGDGSLTINTDGENAAGIICTGSLAINGGSFDITSGSSAISCEGEVAYAEGLGVIGDATANHVVIGALNP